MKRRDLIKLLEKNGWTFKRAGGNHDVYVKGNEREAVERTVKSQKRLHRPLSEGGG